MKLSQGKDSCMEELHSPPCNPLEHGGAAPPLRASLSRADPQQPPEGLVEGAGRLYGGSEGCASMAVIPSCALNHSLHHQRIGCGAAHHPFSLGTLAGKI